MLPFALRFNAIFECCCVNVSCCWVAFSQYRYIYAHFAIISIHCFVRTRTTTYAHQVMLYTLRPMVMSYVKCITKQNYNIMVTMMILLSFDWFLEINGTEIIWDKGIIYIRCVVLLVVCSCWFDYLLIN